VQTWRRLQQLGAIPSSRLSTRCPIRRRSREDFEWLKAEITGAGGEATVFAADNVDAWSDDALVQEFKRTRESSYKELGREMARALAALRSPGTSRRSRTRNASSIPSVNGSTRSRRSTSSLPLAETAPPSCSRSRGDDH
jgi:hypothetical protein